MANGVTAAEFKADRNAGAGGNKGESLAGKRATFRGAEIKRQRAAMG